MAMSFKADTNKLNRLKAKLQALKTPIDQQTAKEIGLAVVKEMKALITSGQSPIQGQKKFPQYKDPKKYPGSQKPKSPVNLTLTGKFLQSLTSKVLRGTSGGFKTEVGYYDSESQKKEQGHRVGANTQPKRPTIPQEGEVFTASIKRVLLDIYRKRLRSLT